MGIDKAELLKMGARSRLVEIEKERTELLRLFPDLEVAPEEKSAKKETNDVPVKKGSHMESVKQIVYRKETVTPGEIAKWLDVSPAHASTLLSEAVDLKIAKRIKRGLYAALRSVKKTANGAT